MKGSLQGLTKKWHGLPVWAWALIVGAVLYLGYRWYENRQAANNSATSSTAGTTGADQTGATDSGLGGGFGGGGGGFPFLPFGGSTTPNPDTTPTTTITPNGTGTEPQTIDVVISPQALQPQSPSSPNTAQLPAGPKAGTIIGPSPGSVVAPGYKTATIPQSVVTALNNYETGTGAGTSNIPVAQAPDKSPAAIAAASNAYEAAAIPAKAPATTKTSPEPVKVAANPSGATKTKKGGIETIH